MRGHIRDNTATAMQDKRGIGYLGARRIGIRSKRMHWSSCAWEQECRWSECGDLATALGEDMEGNMSSEKESEWVDTDGTFSKAFKGRYSFMGA